MTENETTSENEFNLMTLSGHLTELRRRLIYCLIALAVGVTVSFSFAQNILEFLAKPIGGLENLQSIEVTENIGVFMRISLLAGFIFALPVIFYNIIAFIVPGLKPSERKWIYVSIPFASVMFVAGVAFALYIMLPAAIPFLVEFLGIKTIPRLSNYIEFATNLMFWIGVAFETPLLIFVLAKLHIVTPKGLLKQWRIAIVVSAVASATITPTIDPVNMGLLMAPLLALYLISIVLAFFA
ncbi:MAG: twin-arginine translocase subunit TatC [Anaerolineaceae bacterium]|jgi:sec-independent protein translocase protein TatC